MTETLLFGGLFLLAAAYILLRLRRDPFRRTAIPWQSVAEFAALWVLALVLWSAGWLPDLGAATLLVLLIVSRSLICLLAGALLNGLGLTTPALAVYRLGLVLLPARLFGMLLLVNRGALFLGKGQYDQAIDALQAVLALDPERLQPLSACNARIYLGLAYLGRRDYDAARQALQTALLVDPAPPERDYQVPILLNLALTHIQAGQPGAAIEMLDRMLAAEHWPPHGDVAHLNLGIAQAMRGDFTRAEAELTQALDGQLSLDHLAAAHLNRGEAYLLQGRLDEAVADFEAALSLEPDAQRRAYALGYQGFVQAERGRTAEALGLLDEALALDTVDRPLIRAHRGWALHRAGQSDAAIVELQQAADAARDLSPVQVTRIHYLLGRVYHETGQPDAACAQFQVAADVAPLCYHAQLAREALGAMQPDPRAG
ncbi:MAG: tetratricopeptide repeat protein [Chloroflexi bacterium]|nr:tetratricopeptide repeat protein [Chloroflexota bacterium]MBU1747949.1 tetratricopeptide repeat protein [Chloroflexota bacterium]MBU1879203.1 tetratricopeptide repeat protein [Chloroflexota bacterium]